MTARVILSVLMISLGTYPIAWVAARALYGFAATGLFIISQSWLNDACVNEWRGKVIACSTWSHLTTKLSRGQAAKRVDRQLQRLVGDTLDTPYKAVDALHS
jgi:hypothetical protein